jgi:hypothetical protein
LYSYDHAGRLTLATTGGTARSNFGSTPYHETFGYDGFSNLTGRESDSWDWQTSDFDSATYTNNRRVGWGYDADGRNTTIDTRTNTFDAAGRQTHMTAQQVLLNGNHITVNEDFQYDGDGAQVFDSASNLTTYYLRSSLVGGRIIEELNSSGQKVVGYIYGPSGQELARQSSSVVTWRHLTPHHTTLCETYSGNSSFVRTEFDPVGADVAIQPPTQPPPAEGDGDIGAGHFAGIMDARWADFFNTSSGFVVDGHEVSASEAMFYINFGTGNSLRDTAGMTAEAFANAVLSSLGPEAFAPAGTSVIHINVSGIEGTPPHSTIEWQWVNYQGQWVYAPIPTAYSGTTAISGSILTLALQVTPQNLTADQKTFAEKALNRASELLNQKRCRDFVEGIIQRAAFLSEKSALGTDDYIATDGVYVGVNAASALWSYHDALNNGWVKASGISGKSKDGQNVTYGETKQVGHFPVSWNKEYFNLPLDDAGFHTLHEALHQIRYFDDATLANAARAYAGESSRDYSKEKDPVGVASRDLNRILAMPKYCGH